MNQNGVNSLIFIDTNIMLDFYRFRKSEIQMNYLKEIEKHKSLLILTSQTEMEFKKNRQRVILETIGEFRKVGNLNLSIPTILSDAQASKMIKRSGDDIKTQQKKLLQRIENILKTPNKYDPVYKSLQKLFNYSSEYNLDRTRKQRLTIRNLAKKRFILGYPPRKKDDTSIGDAINWEWIIECAKISKKDIIIVTRDSDYGVIYDKDSFLNDWLHQEFKQRVSRKRKIYLTDKLSKAFQLVQIPVSDEMIMEEEKLLDIFKSSGLFWQNLNRNKERSGIMKYLNMNNIDLNDFNPLGITTIKEIIDYNKYDGE